MEISLQDLQKQLNAASELFAQSVILKNADALIFRPFHNVVVDIQDNGGSYKIDIVFTEAGLIRTNFFIKHENVVSEIEDYITIYL